MTTLPKSIEVGETCATGPTPMPVSRTCCVEPALGALSLNTRLVDLVPVVPGLKATATEQLPFGGITSPLVHVFAPRTKEPASRPIKAGGAPIVMGSRPVLVRVM